MNVRPLSSIGNRLQLPETVIIAALKIDGERAMPWDLHGRMGDLAACLNRCGKGRIHVGHKPVGPHHRIFRIAQRCAYFHQPTACQ